MSEHEWTCPDVNDDGFIALRRLKKAAVGKSSAQFQEAYPVPALLSVDRDLPPAGVQELLAPSESRVQLLTVAIEGAAVLRYLGKLAFVTKRPGNFFPHVVSIGRSHKNDITVGVDSVSKMHGYFTHDGEDWSYTDHSSTNGSRIDDRELEARCKYPLTDGCVLQLGIEVTLEFLSPASLFRRATAG